MIIRTDSADRRGRPTGLPVEDLVIITSGVDAVVTRHGSLLVSRTPADVFREARLADKEKSQDEAQLAVVLIYGTRNGRRSSVRAPH
jgi:hypothetical protein